MPQNNNLNINNWEMVVGLEVHSQLNTKTKLFCNCAYIYGKTPNSLICPVCTGQPGTLPVLNKHALEKAIIAAIGLNCNVNLLTKFDRKNYFYPDLPKGYQISQFDSPLAQNGFLQITLDKKQSKNIGITRVHMEEDAGKSIHTDEISNSDNSFIDFNRTGVPLIEIVSEPEISSSKEAYLYLTALKEILYYLNVSDCDMEKGSLRCDANISVRKKGEKKLGTKIELKNLNSFKYIAKALDFEFHRQIELIAEGKKLAQETRLWDEKNEKSILMRVKEGADDYRYFPEPDLKPLNIDKQDVQKATEFVQKHNPNLIKTQLLSHELSLYSTEIIMHNKADVKYFLEIAELAQKVNIPPQDPVNIIQASNSAMSFRGNMYEYVHPEIPVQISKLRKEGKISSNVQQLIMDEIHNSKNTTTVDEIIKNKNLLQMNDTGELENTIQKVISNNPKPVQAYKDGKLNAISALIGGVMRETKGKANPNIVKEILEKHLNKP